MYKFRGLLPLAAPACWRRSSILFIGLVTSLQQDATIQKWSDDFIINHFKFATKVREGVEDDPRTHMIQVFTSIPSLNIDMASFYTFYSEPFDTPPAAIKPFFDLPTTHRTAQNKTAKEANYEINEGFDDGLRYLIFQMIMLYSNTNQCSFGKI